MRAGTVWANEHACRAGYATACGYLKTIQREAPGKCCAAPEIVADALIRIKKHEPVVPIHRRGDGPWDVIPGKTGGPGRPHGILDTFSSDPQQARGGAVIAESPLPQDPRLDNEQS